MAKSTNKMSSYELERLERIRENEKMLEELFPKGTQAIFADIKGKKPIKRRRGIDVNSRGSGSGASSDCLSDQSNSEDESTQRKRSYVVKRVKVVPRRNPSRKVRAGDTPRRMTTRSMSVSSEDQLNNGIEDEQEFKKHVYRTIRRRIQTDVEELPIELDDCPAYPPTRHIKVIDSSTNKVYDRVQGSTCHQCRQKTIDTKTICHNKHCRGLRGQFCAPCLQNRYGESLVDSLRDKKWVCPPCRKICNCSFCMPKRGKAPTGILIHHARDAGCDSVHEYLNKTNYDY